MAQVWRCRAGRTAEPLPASVADPDPAYRKESRMADPLHDIARRKATTGFTASEVRDALVKKELEAERQAFEAKTAKLRALRLAKEAADAAAALKLAAEQQAEKKSSSRKKTIKSQ
jgi:hypothetical protein